MKNRGQLIGLPTDHRLAHEAIAQHHGDRAVALEPFHPPQACGATRFGQRGHQRASERITLLGQPIGVDL